MGQPTSCAGGLGTQGTSLSLLESNSAVENFCFFHPLSKPGVGRDVQHQSSCAPRMIHIYLGEQPRWESWRRCQCISNEAGFQGVPLSVSVPNPSLSPLSLHGRTRQTQASSSHPPSTLNRGTRNRFQDYFSQGDNLLIGLCMSAKLLNFEDSWIKLDVANLHLQIDFVHTGMCTHISGDQAGGVRQLTGNGMTVRSACL